MSVRPLTETVQEYARGLGGGILFSLPLFYTMEVWWVGHSASPLRLLAFVVGTFALLLGYNLYAGIRPDRGKANLVYESVEELGLGLLLATGLLLLLGRIQPGLSSFTESLGKIVVEGMVAAIGISVGTAQLGVSPQDGDSEGAEDEQDQPDGPPPDRSLRGEVVLALCGAILVAANVAPTEEVLMLATEMHWGSLLCLAVLSLAITAGLLYYSNFRGSRRFARYAESSRLGPVRGTVVTYAVALVASAGLLWIFGSLDTASLSSAIMQTVVLGFPAALGAAAGRLLLAQSSNE